MAGRDIEATNGQNPQEYAVEREDSASKAAGHMRLELVDDKPGKCDIGTSCFQQPITHSLASKLGGHPC